MNCPKNAPFGTFLRHLGHRDIVGVKSPFYITGMLSIGILALNFEEGLSPLGIIAPLKLIHSILVLSCSI